MIAGCVLAGVFLLSSCHHLLIGPILDDTPEDNFEAIWQDFDMMYGLFIARGVDWNAAYDLYRPMVTPHTSGEELFNILTSMLELLDDSHVSLMTDNLSYTSYFGGTYGRLGQNDAFDLELIQNDYLVEAHGQNETQSPYTYGRLPDNIGYIHLAAIPLDLDLHGRVLDQAFASIEDTIGIVFDLRNNEGGTDPGAAYVAGRFATERRLYQISRHRNGPNHDDFTEPVYWYVEPTGSVQYTGPVVLLTDRWAVSAADSFTLAMRENSQVTQIGDTTCGAFSNVVFREMPNGWLYSLSIGDWRDKNGVSHEGIGIHPDIPVVNTAEEVQSGLDRALERSMTFLVTGS
jgi:carboxyl-terminal processing protease